MYQGCGLCVLGREKPVLDIREFIALKVARKEESGRAERYFWTVGLLSYEESGLECQKPARYRRRF